MAKRRIIKDMQEKYLRRAKEGDPDDVIRSLYHLLEEAGDEGTKDLSPEWLTLWEKVKHEAPGYLPPDVMKYINKKLAGISVFDSRIQKLSLSRDDRVCVLLGAGASAPPPSSIPTVTQLLPELWRRARRLGREEIDRLIEWCDNHKINNIEDLLTAAYIANFTAKNTAVTGLLDFFLFQRDRGREEEEYHRVRRYPMGVSQIDTGSIALLQDTLQILFGLLTGTMIPADPNRGHDALVSFLTEHSHTSIVTTNYDGCVDEALLKAKLPINTYISDAKSSESVNLIKIHGSINWSYCDSCHDVRDFDLLDTKDAYLKDSLSYAVIGICKTCQGQRRPLLIPPLGLKFIMFPTLIRLWDEARAKIEGAKVLIVVGYSFAEADTYINKIIERSMTVNVKQSMVVCDTNSALVPTLRKRFAARIDGFEESRILPAVGSADDVLPDVLKILVGKYEEKSESKATTKKRATTQRRKNAQPIGTTIKE
jgi:NAD-dependent SIR2 family protein deacetylase